MGQKTARSGGAVDTADCPDTVPAYLTDPYRFVAHYLRAWRWHFAGLALLVLSAAACAVGVQYAMKLLIDAMSAGPDTGGQAVSAVLIGFLGLIVLESLLWRGAGWLCCRTTVGVGIDMRLDLFAQLSGQPLRFFLDRLAGSLGHRITATAGNFGALTNTTVWRIAPPTMDFLGALVVFTLIDWRMALALAAYVVVVTPGLIMVGEHGRPLHRAYAANSGEVAGELTDVISNMWAVKAFSARAREYGRLARCFNGEAASQRASWMYLERTRLVYDMVLWIMAGGMLGWAVHRWSGGHVTTGDVVVVSTLTFRILHGTRDLALSFVEAGQQFGFIEDTLGVVGTRPSVTDLCRSRGWVPQTGSIEFRNVTFAYSRTGRDAIRGIDLFIPSGQKVGIVGPSGAGKSTIVNLIQRLFDVQDGEVLVSGRSVRAIAQDELRSSLAVVPQEISLFHRSVAENIRFGRPDATDTEVFAAARDACCDGFVRCLPQGYDTVVGERGTKLSGGQRQRIGIARALLKRAPILVLDEATSALDTQTELEIQRNLVRPTEGCTVLAVAHRLSTLSAFDRVLVVNEGRIVEDGTYDDLRRAGGVFGRMWRLQAEAWSSSASAAADGSMAMANPHHRQPANAGIGGCL